MTEKARECQWCEDRNAQIFDSKNPVALITGSASDRLGRHIGQLLRECQFRVAFHGHQENDENNAWINSARREGLDLMLVTGDIRNPDNSQSWLRQIMDRWGRVDLVVNSAAIWEPSPLESTSVDHLQQHWEVNVLGGFLTAQQFGLQMVQQTSGGAIINIGDWAVARPYLGFAAYLMSKGNIESLTRAMAVELASRNTRVRVNGVFPGPVMMADGISDSAKQEIAEACLLKRSGSPRDVAEAVYFLATSPFITGVCLPVDGGRSIYAGDDKDFKAHPNADS